MSTGSRLTRAEERDDLCVGNRDSATLWIPNPTATATASAKAMESGRSWGTWICPYGDCSLFKAPRAATTGNEVPPCKECGGRLIPQPADPKFVPWTRAAPQRNRLERITLKGFKTIRSLVDFEPRSRTVLIGPNGAGKSNFISFFRMMSWALSGPDQLARHVSQQGGSRRILHDGPAHTREIEAHLTIRTAAGENEYAFRLFHAAGGTLVFADERYRFSRAGWETKANWNVLGAGHKDPGLLKAAVDNQTAQVIHTLLRRMVVYQFHNTSDTARIRGQWSTNDNRWLKEDAANVAPVLYRLKTRDRQYYQRIVDTIRLVLPVFSDFELEPDYDNLMLQWRERDTDEVFSVSQASDGFLRIVALVTLLLQPEKDLPDVLILDEPELGLHPSAIGIVAELMAATATKIQVIAATQSVPFVDCFNPEDIVVVERPERQSTFERLEPASLGEWLATYSLSELWEKNVIGGRP